MSYVCMTDPKVGKDNLSSESRPAETWLRSERVVYLDERFVVGLWNETSQLRNCEKNIWIGSFVN